MYIISGYHTKHEYYTFLNYSLSTYIGTPLFSLYLAVDKTTNDNCIIHCFAAIGQPWPMPQTYLSESTRYPIDMVNFQIIGPTSTCGRVVRAIDRYTKHINSQVNKEQKQNCHPCLCVFFIFQRISDSSCENKVGDNIRHKYLATLHRLMLLDSSLMHKVGVI